MNKRNWPNGTSPPPRTRARRAALALVALYSMTAGAALQAGSFIFAGEGNGVDVITHPTGYTGTGGVLNVGVCIDPASLNAEDLVIPIRNNIAVWNELQPVASNVQTGALPSNYLDAESILLHEVGHCIGLAHVNAASESRLSGSNTDYTKATDGANNRFDIDPGADGIIGSYDDLRGDDVNLHWFNPSNDPFMLPIPTPVDSTLYKRDLVYLPPGDSFAQNASRFVASAQGYPSSEAVMQQGTYWSETQRDLVSDDASTIMLAASGIDERAGTADDYGIVLSYEGIATGPDCDITVIMENMSGLAYCSVGGYFVGGGDHVRISNASVHLGAGYNYVFNTELRGGGNQPPVAADDSANVDEDDSVSIAVLSNDSDPDGDSPAISAVGNPPNGTAIQSGESIQYTPDANYNGPDSFSYSIADGNGGSDSATVSVTVAPVNDLPVAVDDGPVSTAHETAVDIYVLDNDSDVDGDPLSVAGVTNGASGSVTNQGAYVTYQPAAGFDGEDSFTYTTSDGQPGGTDTATVSVTVRPLGPDYAAADWATVQGSVSGDYLATHAAGGSSESITETHSGGNPSLRTDSLEHIWRFNLTGGNHTFNVNAAADFPAGDADGEFRFEWADNSNGPWQPMVAVTPASSGYQSFDVGAGVSGTVYVRVVDSDDTTGNTVYSTISVDHMYFDGSDAPSNPPPDPGGGDPTELVVGSIALATVNGSRGNKFGQATVAVVDDLGNPVAGATVEGTFSGSYGESASAAADATGVAVLTTAGQVKGGISFTFCVDAISAPDLGYNPAGPDCAGY